MLSGVSAAKENKARCCTLRSLVPRGVSRKAKLRISHDRAVSFWLRQIDHREVIAVAGRPRHGVGDCRLFVGTLTGRCADPSAPGPSGMRLSPLLSGQFSWGERQLARHGTRRPARRQFSRPSCLCASVRYGPPRVCLQDRRDHGLLSIRVRRQMICGAMGPSHPAKRRVIIHT
jgi:hypothetical protein